MEMMIFLWFFFILSFGVQWLISYFHEEARISFIQNRTLAEITVVNNRIENVIKNAYGIVYEQTNTSDDLWKLVVYDDKFEKNTTSIYVERDPWKDISRLMIQRNNDPPEAIHSSGLYVKKLKIATSLNPKLYPERLEDQPWVSYKIEARNRSLLKRPLEDYFNTYNNIYTLYIEGRSVVRNYVPSSLKN